jgi:hypothetical protein
MKYAYLETNIINKALDQLITGGQLRDLLEAEGFLPKFGIHGIYELARTFLNEQNTEIGKKLFTILQDLDPSYQPTVNMLLEQEIVKLRTGSSVLPFLDQLNQAATKQEVLKLARGVFDDKARDFISNREKGIKENHQGMAKDYIDRAKSIQKKIRTFEQALSELKPDFPDLIYKMLHKKVSISEARELDMRLNTFPAIRTTAMANAYMTSISIIHSNAPGKDKIDDFRHLIEASYCNAFLTGDNQLCKAAGYINPEIEVIKWDDFVKEQ